jgi:hypothetical protein
VICTKTRASGVGQSSASAHRARPALSGRFDDAEALYRRALAIAESLHGPDSPALASLCFGNRRQGPVADNAPSTP